MGTATYLKRRDNPVADSAFYRVFPVMHDAEGDEWEYVCVSTIWSPPETLIFPAGASRYFEQDFDIDLVELPDSVRGEAVTHEEAFRRAGYEIVGAPR